MKEAIVRARVDSKQQSDAEAVFGTLGINTASVLRFLRRFGPFSTAPPIAQPSGPATDSFCGLHMKSNFLAILFSIASTSFAEDSSAPAADPVLEPATLRCLGIYWVIKGDANKNARVDVAYRKAATGGGGEWLPGPPLFRVAQGACKDKSIDIPDDAWLFAGSVLDIPETIDLRLNPKSNAVGAAEPLPGFNTATEKSRPDLGAYPVNSDLPQYGPRPEK